MKNYLIVSFFLFPVIPVLSQQEKYLPEAEFETILNEPLSITAVGEGHYFVDFGKAYFGTLLIKSGRDQDAPLTIHLGEKLSGTRMIDRDPPGSVRYQRVKLKKIEDGKLMRIDLIPDERNTNEKAIQLPDSFGVVMPFRYCELENLEIPVEAIQLWQKAYHYRFHDEASHFTSSDKILNAIWDICKHSIKATSFTGFYIDGDRERIPYEGDAYINQLSHYALDSVYSLARRTNEYFLKNPTWPTEWILHNVLLHYNDYLYTGDLEVLRKNYEALKIRTLMDLEREDGLISTRSHGHTGELILKLGFRDPETRIRDIVDWPPAQKDTGWKLATAEGERDGYEMVAVNTVVNSFYFFNLKLMAEIAGFLGKDEDAEFFRKKSEKVKGTINAILFDKTRGVYLDGEGSDHASLHANMFPLAFELVPEEHVASVIRFIKTRGMACSVYGSQYLLEGLYKHGASGYGAQLITDTMGDRNWWNMIRVGSTITLEAWDMKYKPNMDWNHAWGAAPANIITRHLWGIKPLTPGFGTAQIQPQLGDLSHAEIKAPTRKGIIQAEYRSDSGQDGTYQITLPAGMEGRFIPTEGTAGIVFNGHDMPLPADYLKLGSGLNTIEIRSEQESSCL